MTFFKWAIILLCIPQLSFAASSLVLRSDDITVNRLTKVMPAEVEPEQKKADEEIEPIPLDPVTFTVQIRAEESIRLQAMHALSRLTDKTGVMVALDYPTDIPLLSLNIYTPVDVWMVADTGTIIQIIPDIVLGRLNNPISANEPIKAFIYVKAGISEALTIKPHDVISHPYFTPAPKVLK